MKVCTKCGAEKPRDSFNKCKAEKDGLHRWCKSCKRDHMAAYRKANKERIAKDKARYVAENRDSVAAQKARWAAENRDRTLSNVKRWKSENKSRVLASNAKRRAAQLQRTPSWANDQLIAAYYKEAKRLEELTGIEFHVDHIIPLQGELVSGLHVETNLQLLTQHDNLRKGNHYG